MLVEVLSDSTRDYDRGEKFDLHASIPTFHDYLLIEPAHVSVEHRSRGANGEWTGVVKETISDSVSLTSVSVVIPLARVYENVVGR